MVPQRLPFKVLLEVKMLNIYKVVLLSLLISITSYAQQPHGLQSKDIHQKEHEQQEKHLQNYHSDTHHTHDNDIERIQVSASRLGRIVTQSATRTEMINAEEIQEKALMRPGNISMLVAETGGVRVQTTSPSMGSANIRLQGLYGRYTQLLSDGLPLYGGQTASIGLLQIPPTDLANVEIIKGSASSLYGGSALGGVINLISRTPTDEQEGELLLNVTSKSGQDITAYFSTPLSNSFSGSVTAGVHQQKSQDLDDDGWIDMAGYKRASVRPRLYWQGDNGANLYVTMGAMTEQRDGGTLSKALMPDGKPFVQSQDSLRTDLGFIYDQPLGEVVNLNIRGSAMHQDHQHLYGTVAEDDRHESYLIESSLSGYSDKTAWLIGLALQSEQFNSLTYSEFDYDYQVPGLFSQFDYEATDDLSLSISARADWHSEYGTQFSPRISLLYRPSNWLLRGSYGQGFFAPSPFIEDIDEAGLSRLSVLKNIEEEHASTGSLDISYLLGNVETSMTLFSSNIENVTALEIIDGTYRLDNIEQDFDKQVRLVNADGDAQIRGVELLLRYRYQDFKLTGSYLYTDASQQQGNTSISKAIALTPEHSAGAVFMWEEHGSHLVGFEAYYTGTQTLANNPYREKSKAYWHLGLLAQVTLGRVSWFVNAENLLNVRQTKVDPLVLPNQAASGRWTTDIWSRNDGFTVNAGVRIQFGS